MVIWIGALILALLLGAIIFLAVLGAIVRLRPGRLRGFRRKSLFSRVQPAGAGNADAEARNGRRGARLVAAVDSAGPALHFAEAEAVMGRRGRSSSVRFTVAGQGRHTIFTPKFELRGATWKVVDVAAFAVPGGAPVANDQVRVFAEIALRPDPSGLTAGARPLVVKLKQVAGDVIEKKALTPNAGDEFNVVTLEPATAITMLTGVNYGIGIVARAEGKDIAGTNGYTGRIVLEFERLVVTV